VPWRNPRAIARGSLDSMAQDGATGSPVLDAEKMLEFASYVRDIRDAAAEDPKELSIRFGLPESLVRESLKVAGTKKDRPERPDRNGFLIAISRFCKGCARALRNRPVVVSALAGLCVATASEIAKRMDQFAGNITLGVTLVIAFALLVSVNLLIGQARYAILTAFVSVLGWMSLSIVFQATGPRFGLGQVIAMIAVTLFLSGLLAMFLAMAAILGAFIRIRRETSEEERQDRLQLLQRIFDLQEKLTTAPTSIVSQSKWQWVESAREKWAIFSACAGLGVGFILLLERIAIGLPMGEQSPQSLAAFGIANFLLMAIVVPMIGFLTRSIANGFLAGLIFATAKGALDLIHSGPITFPDTLIDFGINALFFALVASIGGVAGTIEERAQRNRQLAAADQTTILSEIIRLQKLLQTGSAEIFVMFIDVVKSTKLKAQEDPLKVEASFRAFHDFVGRTVRHYAGSIHSISGDGAVAKFNNASDALEASRALQREIQGFNQVGNRLEQPFRVRIGLHCGQVHGELDQVVFTNVVDVAAHIEKYAPPGGIVVTGQIKEHLPDERFAQLDERVDSHPVFIVLDVSS